MLAGRVAEWVCELAGKRVSAGSMMFPDLDLKMIPIEDNRFVPTVSVDVTDLLRDDINSGVLVINKPVINQDIKRGVKIFIPAIT